jgi:branched-subunit amino acid ABC-type transport system permease component
MIDQAILLQILWTGIAMSSYFVLLTIAFALTLKVEKLWNFAQAGLMGIAFFTMFATVNRMGLPGWAGIGIGLAVTVAAAVLLEVCAISVLRARHSGGLTFFIFTLVFSQFAAYVLTFLFGTEPETIYPSVMSPVRIVGGIAISNWDLQAIATTVLLVAALWGFLRFTRDGQFMIAVADNAKLAEIYGISAKRAYVMSGAIAAVFLTAGIYLYGSRAGVTPDVPLVLVLTSVIGTLLGGLGRVFAAGAAAVFLGLLQSFSILVIPSKWQAMLLYAVLFGALILFPRGIPGWQLRRPRAPAAAPVLETPSTAEG